MSRGRLYIFAGGGSGGHLYPGIAAAEAMLDVEPEAKVLFLCTARQIDRDILQGSDWPYETQPVMPLPGRLGEIWPFWRGWRGSVRMCEQLFRRERPAAVLGLGGFASGPAMKTAARLKIPVAMLNPDAVPGKANKYCRKYADKIFLQWQAPMKYFPADQEKCVVTGCPIRREFAERMTRNEAKNQLGLDADRRVLVVMGGSQGGRNVNAALVRCLTCGQDNDRVKAAIQDWQMVHITGKNDRDWVCRQYKEAGIPAKVLDFTRDMPIVLAAADLVVGRAGASSLAELTAVGVASILLPYPYHKDQHQRHNAQVLETAGAAQIVIDDRDADSTAQRLAKVLPRCMAQETLEQMARAAGAIGNAQAAKRVAEEIRVLTN